VRVAAGEGDAVAAGTPIVVLEAMKMEHTVRAPADGVVTSILVTQGQQVDSGAVLAVVQGEEQ
jgi:propionyl-CoA carboxylase alpha chain